MPGQPLLTTICKTKIKKICTLHNAVLFDQGYVIGPQCGQGILQEFSICIPIYSLINNGCVGSNLVNPLEEFISAWIMLPKHLWIALENFNGQVIKSFVFYISIREPKKLNDWIDIPTNRVPGNNLLILELCFPQFNVFLEDMVNTLFMKKTGKCIEQKR